MNRQDFLNLFGAPLHVDAAAAVINPEEEARRAGISGPITKRLFDRWNTIELRQALRVEAARGKIANNMAFAVPLDALNKGAGRFMRQLETTQVSEFVETVVMPQNARSAGEGEDDGDAEVSGRRRQRFFRCVKDGRSYQTAIASFFKACYLWSQEPQRTASSVEFRQDVLAALDAFKTGVDTAVPVEDGEDDGVLAAMKQLASALLAQSRDKNDSYANCPLQAFLLGSLVRQESGLPVLAAQAQKASSALKYLLRGIELAGAALEPRSRGREHQEEAQRVRPREVCRASFAEQRYWRLQYRCQAAGGCFA